MKVEELKLIAYLDEIAGRCLQNEFLFLDESSLIYLRTFLINAERSTKAYTSNEVLVNSHVKVNRTNIKHYNENYIKIINDQLIKLFVDPNSDMAVRRFAIFFVVKLIDILQSTIFKNNEFVTQVKSNINSSDTVISACCIKLVGFLNISSFSIQTDLIDNELKINIKNLTDESFDFKLYSLLTLRELAFTAPTNFFQCIQPFFQHCINYLKDPQLAIRICTADIIRISISIFAQRSLTVKMPFKWYQYVFNRAFSILDEFHKGENHADNSVDLILSHTAFIYTIEHENLLNNSGLSSNAVSGTGSLKLKNVSTANIVSATIANSPASPSLYGGAAANAANIHQKKHTLNFYQHLYQKHDYTVFYPQLSHNANAQNFFELLSAQAYPPATFLIKQQLNLTNNNDKINLSVVQHAALLVLSQFIKNASLDCGLLRMGLVRLFYCNSLLPYKNLNFFDFDLEEFVYSHRCKSQQISRHSAGNLFFDFFGVYENSSCEFDALAPDIPLCETAVSGKTNADIIELVNRSCQEILNICAICGSMLKQSYIVRTLCDILPGLLSCEGSLFNRSPFVNLLKNLNNLVYNPALRPHILMCNTLLIFLLREKYLPFASGLFVHVVKILEHQKDYSINNTFVDGSSLAAAANVGGSGVRLILLEQGISSFLCVALHVYKERFADLFSNEFLDILINNTVLDFCLTALFNQISFVKNSQICVKFQNSFLNLLLNLFSLNFSVKNISEGNIHIGKIIGGYLKEMLSIYKNDPTKMIVVSLISLRVADFNSNNLIDIALMISKNFLNENYSSFIKKEAVKTCATLLHKICSSLLTISYLCYPLSLCVVNQNENNLNSTNVNNSETLIGQIHYILSAIIAVAVSDSDPKIRICALLSLQPKFDTFLTRIDHIESIMLTLHDNDYQIRNTSVEILGRLCQSQSAVLLPAIGAYLVEELNSFHMFYTNTDMSNFIDRNFFLENSAVLLGSIVKNCSRISRDSLDAILAVVIPCLISVNSEMYRGMINYFKTVIFKSDKDKYTSFKHSKNKKISQEKSKNSSVIINPVNNITTVNAILVIVAHLAKLPESFGKFKFFLKDILSIIVIDILLLLNHLEYSFSFNHNKKKKKGEFKDGSDFEYKEVNDYCYVNSSALDALKQLLFYYGPYIDKFFDPRFIFDVIISLLRLGQSSFSSVSIRVQLLEIVGLLGAFSPEKMRIYQRKKIKYFFFPTGKSDSNKNSVLLSNFGYLQKKIMLIDLDSYNYFISVNANSEKLKNPDKTKQNLNVLYNFFKNTYDDNVNHHQKSENASNNNHFVENELELSNMLNSEKLVKNIKFKIDINPIECLIACQTNNVSTGNLHSANVMNMNTSLNQFYYVLTIETLLKILNDTTLKDIHILTLHRLEQIVLELGSNKSILYLAKLIDAYLYLLSKKYDSNSSGDRPTENKSAENSDSATNTIRLVVIQQLSKLISLVGSQIQPHVNKLYNSLKELWQVESESTEGVNISSDMVIQTGFIGLLDSLTQALPDEAKGRLPSLMPKIVCLLEKYCFPSFTSSADNEKLSMVLVSRLLISLKKLTPFLYTQLKILMPTLVKILQMQSVNLDIKQAGLETINEFCNLTSMRHYISLLMMPILELFVSSRRLRPVILRLLYNILELLGQNFFNYQHLVFSYFDKIEFEAENEGDLVLMQEFRSAVDNLIYKGRVSCVKKYDQVLKIQNYSIINPLFGKNKGGEQFKKQLPNSNTNTNINQGSISSLTKATWITSNRVSKDDWVDWLKRLSSELLKYSPVAILSSLSNLSEAHPILAKQLFNASFASCWPILKSDLKASLKYSIGNAMQAVESPETLFVLLNLMEFVGHIDMYDAWLDLKLMCNACMRLELYCKALFFCENLYMNLIDQQIKKNSKRQNFQYNNKIDKGDILLNHVNTHVNISKCIEQLISINSRLNNLDASKGLLLVSQNISNFNDENNVDNILPINTDIETYPVQASPSPPNTTTTANNTSSKNEEFFTPESWFEEMKDYQGALNSYNVKLKNDNTNYKLLTGKMKCLESLGEWNELKNLLNTHFKDIDNNDSKNKFLAQVGAAASLNTGDIFMLEKKYVPALPIDTVDGSFYRSVIYIFHGRHEEARLQINTARELLQSEIIKSSVLIGDSYERNYNSYMYAQLLKELEDIIQYVNDENLRPLIKNIWDRRLDNCVKSVENWQKVLHIRSMILPTYHNLYQWLKFAKLCRKTNRTTLSNRIYNTVLQDEAENIEEIINNDRQSDKWPKSSPMSIYAFLKSKYERQPELALNMMERFTLKLMPKYLINQTNSKQEYNKLISKCYYQLGKWEKSVYDLQSHNSEIREKTAKIVNYYYTSTQYDKDNFKSFHGWALMNYEILNAYKSNRKMNDQVPLFKEELANMYAVTAIEGFLESIKNSKEYGFQDSLRLLTIWFDWGEFSSCYRILEERLRSVPSETFLHTIPQLIARIDSKKPNIVKLIQQLLIDIGHCHPQSLIYPIAVAARNADSSKKINVLPIVSSLTEHSHNLMYQAMLVSDELIRVSILWVEQWQKALVEAFRAYFHEKNIVKMYHILEDVYTKNNLDNPTTVDECNFVQHYKKELIDAWECIKMFGSNFEEASKGSRKKNMLAAWEMYQQVNSRMVKQLKNLKSIELSYVSPRLLEAVDLSLAIPGTYKPHKPIQKLYKVQPTLMVYVSKQRPRQLKMQANDGSQHTFLLKGNEDLRQDERVMQMLDLVNSLLRKDVETCKRDLQVVRYSVIPLSIESGLLGFVPDCDTLNTLISKYRVDKKVPVKAEEAMMRKILPNYDYARLHFKQYAFEESLYATKGDDLSQIIWLKSANCEIWYAKRVAYMRSLATMSMVGYILGLGDRHLSNIMMQRNTGQVVHIDFGDCFEVAMQRDSYPECVPFRLTRLLIGAMEITGVRGTFRNTCQHVMRVLREHSDSLLAVLEAFVYDPLLNWKLVDYRNVPEKGEDEQAVEENEELVNMRKRSQMRGEDEEEGSNARAMGQYENEINERGWQVINRIRDKLCGKDIDEQVVMSETDQVDSLIRQATMTENLCRAYMGWCPHL